jgi:hypothetical protein
MPVQRTVPGIEPKQFFRNFKILPAQINGNPPIQWVPGSLSLGVKRPDLKLTKHLHLVLRLIMRGATPPLPQYTFMAWCSFIAQGQRHLYLMHL